MKNKFLTLEWFKEILHLETKELKKQKEVLTKEIIEKPIGSPEEVYKAIRLINSSLTIILRDGNILKKADATEDDYNQCLAALSTEEIRKIITRPVHTPLSKEVELTTEEVISINKGYGVLKNLSDFTFEGDTIYWGGIKRSLPQQLVEAICKVVIDEEGNPALQAYLNTYGPYLSLKKFWYKCCLNPNAQSAEDLYTFLSKHVLKIDRHGNFYAYRKVVTKDNNTNKELAEFVSNTYIKIKSVWKKNPKNYRIVTIPNSKEYLLKDSKFNVENTEYICLGDLNFLYNELPKMQNSSYTSSHTGKEDYRIGEIISMPRYKGDDDNRVSCSKGFHGASRQYNYEGFGDTYILMIINPSDVLSVPIGEVGKLRTCRWYFACVLSKEEKYILDDEQFTVTDLGDLFEEKCLINLEDYITNSFAEEVKRHSFKLPYIKEGEIKRIIASLEEMQWIIKSRVKNI